MDEAQQKLRRVLAALKQLTNKKDKKAAKKFQGVRRTGGRGKTYGEKDHKDKVKKS